MAVRTSIIGYGPNLAQNSESVGRLLLLKIDKIRQTAHALINPHFVAFFVLFATTFKTVSETFCRMSGANFDDTTSIFLTKRTFLRSTIDTQQELHRLKRLITL